VTGYARAGRGVYLNHDVSWERLAWAEYMKTALTLLSRFRSVKILIELIRGCTRLKIYMAM